MDDRDITLFYIQIMLLYEQNRSNNVLRPSKSINSLDHVLDVWYVLTNAPIKHSADHWTKIPLFSQ